MPKIMLVEDDNNLREIYGERLMAEGYEIVSAADGEEALALAVKERPDLIISDVMMPKISGFDMLDILRQTPETKNTKIIMMTALSQLEDKDRASKLGADKYLVKSQVTLEDVARVVHDILYGQQPVDTPPANPVINQQPVMATPQTSTATAPTPAVANAQTNVTQPVTATAPINPVTVPAAVAASVVQQTNVPMQPTPSTSVAAQTPSIVPSQPLAVEPTPTPVVAPNIPTEISSPAATMSEINTPSAQPTVAPPVVEPDTPITPVVSSFNADTAAPTSAPVPSNTEAPEVKASTSVAPATLPVNSSESTSQVPDAVASTESSPPALTQDSSTVNPITGAPAFTPSLPSDASPQTAEQEVSAVAQQIESFLAGNTSESSTHEEPMIEPNANTEPAPEVSQTMPIAEPFTTTEPPTTLGPSAPESQDKSTPTPMDTPSEIPEMASTRKKVISPISSPEEEPNIYQLYEKEMAEEAASTNTSADGGTIIATPTNPIAESDKDETPPPLETFDPTSLGGVQTEDESSGDMTPIVTETTQTPLADGPAEPKQPAAPQPSGAMVSSTPPSAPPAAPGSSFDPNQISL